MTNHDPRRPSRRPHLGRFKFILPLGLLVLVAVALSLGFPFVRALLAGIHGLFVPA
jgi:hypothetical protein